MPLFPMNKYKDQWEAKLLIIYVLIVISELNFIALIYEKILKIVC